MNVVIVIPAYNEELILEKSILKLFSFCQSNLNLDWKIVIANNNSSDRTGEIAQKLAATFSQIEYLFIDIKGKGAAIKTAWENYSAEVYCFMDADLATDLAALPELIKGIRDGNDLVIGSRFHPQSKVSRSLVRKLVSLAYQLVLKIILQTKINDAPCGFKAINHKVRQDILPQIKNQQWFFDSELVILAEKKGFRIKEIPVIWHDLREGQDKSRVKTLSLGLAYFKEVLKLKKRLKNEKFISK